MLILADTVLESSQYTALQGVSGISFSSGRNQELLNSGSNIFHNPEVRMAAAIVLGDFIDTLYTVSANQKLYNTPDHSLPAELQKMYKVDDRSPADVVLWMQKLTIVIAENYSKLRTEFNKLTENPAEKLTGLISTKIKNHPDMIFNALAIIAFLDADDYKHVSKENNFVPANRQSLGTILTYTTIPEILRGRLILVNEGDGLDVQFRTDKQIWVTQRHEQLHTWYRLIAALNDREKIETFSEKLEQMPDALNLNEHAKLADRFVKSIYDIACSEVISYYSTGVTKVNEDFFFMNFIPQLRNNLNKFLALETDDIAVKNQISKIYETKITDLRSSFNHFEQMALKLYSGEVCHSLSHSQVDALLMLTLAEDAMSLRAFAPSYDMQTSA